MQRLSTFLLAVIVVAILITSCKKEPATSALDYIPANSDMVLTMNMGQLSEKMNFNEIKNSTGLGFIGGLLSMQGIPNFIADRSVTGVDFDNNFYLFFNMENPDEPQGGVVFQIAEEAKFLEFVNKVGKNITVEEGDGFSYLNAGDGLLGWKDGVGLLLMEELDTESPATILGKHFSLPREESMQASEQASALTSGAHDISMMLRPAGLQQAAANDGVTFDLGEDVVFLNTMDFSKGEITSTGIMTASEETMARYKEMVKPSFNTDLLSGLPKADYPAFFAMRMDGAGLDSFLESTGLYEAAAKDADEEMLTNLKIVRDLSNAMTGELFIGFSGLEATEKDVTEDAMAMEDDYYMESEDDELQYEPIWSMVAGVKDEAAVTVFLDKMVADTQLVKHDGYYAGIEGENPGIIVLRNNALYITTYDNYFDAMIEGSTEGAAESVVEKLSSYPLYAMVNGEQLFTSIESALAMGGADEGILKQLKGLMGTMEIAEMISYEPTDTEWKSVATIRMKEKDKNALEVVTASMVKSIMDMGMLGM